MRATLSVDGAHGRRRGGRARERRLQARGSDSRLIASQADRGQVLDALKAAFVQGRLTKAEFDHRVGQALAELCGAGHPHRR